VNFLVAAKVAMEDRLYGPSVAMSYSAAYSTLTAFLALSGRLWVDLPVFRKGDAIHSSPNNHQKVIVARLTMANRWIYEPAVQSHKARWRDLVTLFVPRSYPIPIAFQRFFSYVYDGRHKPIDDLADSFKNPSKYRYDIREVLGKFLDEISDIRHISLYAGFGGDPGVYDALMNGDLFDASRLSACANAFMEFAHCFAREVSVELSGLAIDLALTVTLQQKIGIRLRWPVPFDEPRVDLLEDGQLKTNCAYIWRIGCFSE
jgi:hypothetical protein